MPWQKLSHKMPKNAKITKVSAPEVNDTEGTKSYDDPKPLLGYEVPYIDTPIHIN